MDSASSQSRWSIRSPRFAMGALTVESSVLLICVVPWLLCMTPSLWRHASISMRSERRAGRCAAVFHNLDVRDVQTAFLRIPRFPPPASCPAVFARTDGARARLTANAWITARVQRIDGDVEGLQISPDIGFGPVRERIELSDTTRCVLLFFMQLYSRYGLLAPLSRDPRTHFLQRAIQRFDFTNATTAFTQIHAFIERVQTVIPNILFHRLRLRMKLFEVVAIPLFHAIDHAQSFSVRTAGVQREDADFHAARKNGVREQHIFGGETAG